MSSNTISSSFPTKEKVHMLSVGINYSGDYKLFGCHNDVESLKKFLYEPKEKGEYSCLMDTEGVSEDQSPTFENICREIEKIYSKVKPGDTVFFTFSGHGGQVKDSNGDESDSSDECIFDVNLFRIKDDLLSQVLVEKLPNGVCLVAILDCCHSGTGLDLPWVYKPFVGKDLESENFTTKKIYCISGCSDPQTSADAWIDRKAQGALTAHLCLLLKEKEDQGLPLTWKEFMILLHYNIKKNGYAQSPVLSYSYSTLLSQKLFL